MGKDYKEAVDVLFDKVENLVSTKTVIGDAIVIGNITIMPFIEVSVGAGASAKEGVTATGGVGAKIKPNGIMVIQDNTVQILGVGNQDAISKLIDAAPAITKKLDFSDIFKNRNSEDTNTENSPIDISEKKVTEEF